MLEKIGLPPKPSLRGNTWVVDASHCQGCASPFTFINRKHHCRRCGGIFCGSCTQQRMLLRGQGDSPVRICEPCKKLEEAARFELRHGHKNRAIRGGSKLASRKDSEDEAKILSKQITGSASSSNREQSISQNEGGDDIAGHLSLDQPTNSSADLKSATPEELREQAVLEKKRYKTLKAEGKSEEALQAFKRGKELERQAGALDISIRKIRKRALSTSNFDDAQPAKDHSRTSFGKDKLTTEKSKGEDDLSAELKELGWSDADLRDAEKRPATLTVEGELSSLLREVSQKPGKEKQSINPDKSRVMAHKKKALELKRAGNLTVAKEELKQAKILERKIEEEELLGGSDDSDDELSLLMRSLESDEHDNLQSKYKSDIGFDFNQFVDIDDYLGADGNFEVTNEDMEDPEMASALKSFGWDEDTSGSKDVHGSVSSSSRESLLSEIQNLKREAVNQKRAGNASEAMALLRKAKVLEMESTFDTQDSNLRAEDSTTVQKTSVGQSVEDTYSGLKLSSKSKLTIQKELIAMKKKALSLRREGKLDESEEQLRKAKVLEQQLEEMNAAPVVAQPSIQVGKASTTRTAFSDGDDEEVTDQDLNDPAYLSLLKNLGWQDEEPKENEKAESFVLKENENASSVAQSILNIEAGTSRKSRSEIQRELLALKRKALTLRREGEVEAAGEVLNNARLLEVQLQEYDEPTQRYGSSENSRGNASVDVVQHSEPSLEVDKHEIGMGDLAKQDKVRSAKSEETLSGNDKSHEHGLSSSQAAVDSQLHSRPQQADKKLDDHSLNSSRATVSEPNSTSPQQQILAHKRKAVSLKREGKLAEAKEELQLAKLLEKRMEEDKTRTSTNSVPTPVLDVSSSLGPKLLSSRERFKLQQESLGHKRQALKLRREGKTAEADAEFELAKALEAQLQESDETAAGSSKTVETDVNVEDFLDPQLLSALQSIGIETVQGTPPNQGIERSETAKSNASNADDAEIERKQLAERIKAEKLKAVNLKRAGKQAEALDALRRAKLYEKKLQSLNPN